MLSIVSTSFEGKYSPHILERNESWYKRLREHIKRFSTHFQRSRFNGDSTSKCSKWSGKKAVLFSTRGLGPGDSLQGQSTVEMLAGETSDSGSESRGKKRRLSGDRGHVAEAVKRVKRELNILLQQDKSSLVEFKDSFSDIESNVEKLVQNIR